MIPSKSTAEKWIRRKKRSYKQEAWVVEFDGELDPWKLIEEVDCSIVFSKKRIGA